MRASFVWNTASNCARVQRIEAESDPRPVSVKPHRASSAMARSACAGSGMKLETVSVDIRAPNLVGPPSWPGRLNVTATRSSSPGGWRRVGRVDRSSGS